jgi:ABC-2 type transport system permease protein
MKLSLVLAIAFKEAREIFRDRIFLLLAFLMAPMMMLLFGYGMEQEVKNLPLAILDYDQSAMSRDYSSHFIAARSFQFRGYLHTPQQAEQSLREGKCRAVIIIPDQFQKRLSMGQTVQVSTLLDGTFTFTVRTVRGYLEAISGAASGEIQQSHAAKRLGIAPTRMPPMSQPVRIEVNFLYNQELRTIWTLAPMVMMIVLMWITPMLLALSVVRENETGSIYNIYASTVRRTEYLAGKLFPNIILSSVNALVLFLLAVFYFGAPFKGNLLLFACATLLYVLATSCFGLLISLMVRTQQAALLASIILGAMVAMQYSGLQTPIADMKGMNWLVAHCFPAMYYTAIIEATFLKGGGLMQIWSDLLALLGCSVWMGSVTLLQFHKRVRI